LDRFCATTQNTAKQNYRGSVAILTTLDQESTWAYSTTLPSQRGAHDVMPVAHKLTAVKLE